MEAITALLRDARLMAPASIEAQREAMERFAGGGQPVPDGCRVEDTSLGGRPAERIVPADADGSAAVLYLHGGAYCLGSPATHRNLAGRLAVASGSPVHVLDYRLGPEHPFPAAVDDAVSAVAALHRAGVSAASMAVAGDSAGGGLVMATLLALRRAGADLPAAAVCFSPWADLTQSGRSYEHLADVDPMLSKESLDVLAAAYLAGADPTDALASPLFAADFRGLPPVLVDVGEHEVLRDDAVRLADRLQGDGVEVTFTVWPEMIHVFQAFPGPLVPEADESIEKAGRFVADRVRPAPVAVD
jgi:acetyl esterase/lipase